MSASKTLKAVFDRINRSDFLRLLTPVFPRCHKSENYLDALGGLMVVCLVGGVVMLMRLVLAH